MNLSSRLAIPAIIGGTIAIFVSGVFSPPVMANGGHAERMARVGPGSASLSLRVAPDADAAGAGELASATWVWLEECVAASQAVEWCLVERAGTSGWARADQLALHWE